MLKIRIIPILTFNGFALVKTKQFSNPRMVGNAIQAARVFNSRGVDELVFLDIYSTVQKRKIDLAVVKLIIKECFMPVGIGGGITCLEDISNLLKIGADKVVLKTSALTNPRFVQEAVETFGSQCITVAVDAKKERDEYFIENKLNKTITVGQFIKECEQMGAGELIVNSVDNDGMMEGFDVELFKKIGGITTLPVVACGGGGCPRHYVDLLDNTDITAVASSSIFYFTRYTPNDIKKELMVAGKPVRII